MSDIATTDITRFGYGSGRQLKESSTKVNLADKAEEYLGGKGFTLISSTVTTTPPAGQCFFCIQVLADVVINTYAVDASAPITGTITATTFSAGTFLYGKFTSIKLTSGTIIAYQAVL